MDSRPKPLEDEPNDERRIKIGLFGPVHPYRGGIAQYTTQLKRSLEKNAAVTTISFKRQYPKWLYPGQSDKEPGSEGQLEPGVHYVLDALSPLSWHRAASRLIADGCDHAILNWWTLFWAPAFAYISWRLRRHRIRTSFLCHNLTDHDSRGLKAFITKRLLSQADSYILHSRDEARILRLLYPGKPILQRLLPVFDHYPAAISSLPKRGRLELLFFGFIRPYKGLDILLEAFNKLRDPEVYLTIVGESWGEDAVAIDAARRQGTNIEAHLAYVDNLTAAAYFDRADIVVLPYLSATGSAVVTLAYHYRKAVLASRVGGLEDAVVPGETGWLVAPGSAEALAEALSHADRASAAGFRTGIEAFIQRNSWDAMASAIIRF